MPASPRPADDGAAPRPASPNQAPVAPSRVRVEVAALTDVGRVRETNEDAYLVSKIGRYLEPLASNLPEALAPRAEESGYLMLVADGMGGHAAGEVASHTAIAATVAKILDSPKWILKLDDPATRDQEIRELWELAREYFARMHAAVVERAAGDRALQGMGTTLTSAYSVWADLFVTHVGDSRAYLFRDDRIEKMTRDHTLAQRYVDLGLMAPGDPGTTRFQHVLTQAIGGNDEEPEADMHRVELAHGDRVLLCTDGLSNLLSEEDMAGVIRRSRSAEDACRSLVDLALARGAPDNITVVLASYTIDPV
jgi:PPM family protein phosphatase